MRKGGCTLVAKAATENRLNKPDFHCAKSSPLDRKYHHHHKAYANAQQQESYLESTANVLPSSPFESEHSSSPSTSHGADSQTHVVGTPPSCSIAGSSAIGSVWQKREHIPRQNPSCSVLHTTPSRVPELEAKPCTSTRTWRSQP